MAVTGTCKICGDMIWVSDYDEDGECTHSCVNSLLKQVAFQQEIIEAREKTIKSLRESNDQLKMSDISWKHVLYPHSWIGHIDKMQDMAKTLGYLYFSWNGRVYETKTAETTDLTPF